MYILPLVGYAGVLFGFAFLTLAIASGLYYLSELVEEHTVFAKKVLSRLIYVLVILNHYLWFRHFSTPPAFSSSRSQDPSRYDYPDVPSFSEVASYFGICVWLVPFAMFVSLSAGENILPSMGSEYATGDSKRKDRIAGSFNGNADRTGKKGAKGLVKAAIDSSAEWVGETGEAMGLWRGNKRRF
ncbi:MAG: hypothetical protein Q9210_000079 [Variospora velana]